MSEQVALTDLNDDVLYLIYKSVVEDYDKIWNPLDYGWAALKLSCKKLYQICEPPLTPEVLHETYDRFDEKIMRELMEMNADVLRVIDYMYGGLIVNSSPYSANILVIAIMYGNTENILRVVENLGDEIACDVADIRYAISSMEERGVNIPSSIMIIYDYIRDNNITKGKRLDDYDIAEYRTYAEKGLLSKRFVEAYIEEYSCESKKFIVKVVPEYRVIEVSLTQNHIYINDIRRIAERTLKTDLRNHKAIFAGKSLVYTSNILDYGIKSGDTIHFQGQLHG
jgi:hypothetical protein